MGVLEVFHFFFLAAAALSTRLGYGRPAFLALAFAEAFCEAVSFVLFFLGLSVSQNGFAILFAFVSAGNSFSLGLCIGFA